MPGLDAQWEALDCLRQVISKWKLAKGEGRSDIVPNVLYYFSGGIDTRFLNKISPLATDLGVRLYRAKVKFTRAGSVEEPEDYESRRQAAHFRHRYGDSDDEDDGKNDDVKFDEVLIEEFTVKKLVTLDGNLLDKTAGMPFGKGEIIPISVLDSFDKPDGRRYGGIWVNRFNITDRSRLLTVSSYRKANG